MSDALLTSQTNAKQKTSNAGRIAGQTVTEYEPRGKAAAQSDALYSLILSKTQSLKTEAKRGKAKLEAPS